MRAASLLLPAWLSLSALVIPQPTFSAVLTFCAGAVALVAAIAAGERWLPRFLWTGAAMAVAGMAAFAPSVPDLVALNHAVVAPLLLLLALVEPGTVGHLPHARQGWHA